MTKEIHICPCCGKEFIPCKKTQIMCSKSCVTKTRWKNQKYRDEKLKQLNDRWKDENYRKKIRIACSKSWTDEMRKKQSETQVDIWKNEKFYKEHCIINKEITNRKEVKDKISKSVIETWKNADERKKKLIERCKDPKIIEKIRKTMIKIFNTPEKKEFFSKTSKLNWKKKTEEEKKAIIKKVLIAKKERKSFNTSKPEEDIYNLLIKKFKCVKRQYNCEKYPFDCDFYIKDLDLFIEYQGFVTHGEHPFNNNDIEDIRVLDLLRESFSSFNKKRIEVWTIKDPLKRQIAKDNGLNWIEFFTMKEFMEWYNNFGEI